MPYRGERSSSLGIGEFTTPVTPEEVKAYEDLLRALEDLESKLGEEDVVLFPKGEVGGAVGIAVDGGEGLAFENQQAFGGGLIRIAPGGVNADRYPPLTYRILSPGLLDLGKSKNREERYRSFVRSLFEPPVDSFVKEVIHTFSQATGIQHEDLGKHYTKDLATLVRVLREVLEWAYTVWLVEEMESEEPGLLREVVFIRDGRLAQSGVTKAFRQKITAYTAQRGLLLIGVSKGSALLAEGMISLIVRGWLERYTELYGHERFAVKVPVEVMEAAYRYERQWNPRSAEAIAMGIRYVTRLYKRTLDPTGAIVVFDVMPHMGREEVKRAAATLHEAKTLSYGGSILPLIEAHSRASIAKSLVRSVEESLFKELSGKMPPEQAERLRRLLRHE